MRRVLLQIVLVVLTFASHRGLAETNGIPSYQKLEAQKDTSAAKPVSELVCSQDITGISTYDKGGSLFEKHRTGECCKVCTKGQACGNSCISWSKTCHQPPGCACQG